MDLVPLLVILISILSGLLSGMFGIGGGIFIQPALCNMLEVYYPSITNPYNIAKFTSFTCIASMGLCTLIVRRKAITQPVWYYVGIYACVVTGFALKKVLIGDLTDETVRQGFYLFTYLLGLQKIYSISNYKHASEIFAKALPIWVVLISMVASTFGVGGGTLLFPVYLRASKSKEQASVLGSITTVMISITILFNTGIQSESIVYDGEIVANIYLPVLFGVMSIGVFATRFGIWANKYFSGTMLERLLGGMLISVAVSSLSTIWIMLGIIPIVGLVLYQYTLSTTKEII